jgi:NTP pyrophosphatase (non-canonical NTP hydrolase)
MENNRREKTINELQRQISGWADEIFPARTAQSTYLKLFEELGELVRSGGEPSEFADVLILLLDLCHLYGVDVETAVHEKMSINKKRRWEENELGVWRHE